MGNPPPRSLCLNAISPGQNPQGIVPPSGARAPCEMKGGWVGDEGGGGPSGTRTARQLLLPELEGDLPSSSPLMSRERAQGSLHCELALEPAAAAAVSHSLCSSCATRQRTATRSHPSAKCTGEVALELVATCSRIPVPGRVPMKSRRLAAVTCG